MKAGKIQSEGSESVVLVVRFQGKKVVAEEAHFKFSQLDLIPAEIKKVLELIKRTLSGFVLEAMPHDPLVFEIHPHVAHPDSGPGQEWMASIETSKPLASAVRAKLYALACHILSQITHGSRELFSVAITDAQSQRFDGQNCIREPIEKFLNANGGKPLQQTFSVSADLTEQNPIIVSGNVAEPEPRQFESEDISGVGMVDGFRESRNEAHLFPVLDHRIARTCLAFRCTDSSIYRVLAEAHCNQQQVRYKARTALNSNGRSVENELLAVELIDDEPFELV